MHSFVVNHILPTSYRLLQLFRKSTYAVGISCACVAWNVTPAAFAFSPGVELQQQVRNYGDITQVRARGRVAVRTRTAVGPRGGVYHSRTVVRAGAVGRPGYAGGGVRWVRPYGWPRGGAIAAGAAIGVVTAATAAAWAGTPPAPGMCWYYTNSSRTQGFWDYCR